MIKVENLSRSYGDFLAVDQVSFEIKQGEIVGLLGHNGAGKTTIMKMLTGYLEPTSGTVEIDGMEISSQRQIIQGGIGYLPENCPIYPEMTVVDYLDYAAALHARFTKGWGGKRIAWFAIIGFAAVMFTYYGVNYLLSSLHSYG